MLRSLTWQNGNSTKMGYTAYDLTQGIESCTGLNTRSKELYCKERLSYNRRKDIEQCNGFSTLREFLECHEKFTKCRRKR